MTTDLAVIEAALAAAKLPDDYNGWALVEPEGLRGAKFVVWVSKLATTAAWPPDGVCDRTSWITSVPLLDPRAAAELVERVKAAEAEVERLRLELDAAENVKMTRRAKFWKRAYLAVESQWHETLDRISAQMTRAETAESTIARVRELAESVPKTVAFNPSDAAYLSGQVDFAEAVLDALNHTDGISPESAASDELHRFTSANSARADETTLRARAEDATEPKSCSCRACNPDSRRMIVCATCGNKRCPHASNHAFQCTWSNEPDQDPILRPTDQRQAWRCHETITLRDEEHTMCRCVWSLGHDGDHSDGLGTTWTALTDQRYEPPAVDDESGCCR